VKEKLVPNLPAESVVIDSALYQNIKVRKTLMSG
jgi:hypothetical protein